MAHGKWIAIIFGLMILPIQFIFSQTAQNSAYKEIGIPSFSTFSYHDYGVHVQHWSVAQDHRGLMYFGSSNGVHEYDGNTWRRIHAPGNSEMRHLAVDNNGRVYAGSIDDFGYLAPNAQGEMAFVSLIKHVPMSERAFGQVRGVAVTTEGAFFVTEKRLFGWQSGDEGNSGRMHIWEAQSRFNRIWAVKNRLYVKENGAGLQYLHNGSLLPVAGGESLANQSICFISPLPGKRGVDQTIAGAFGTLLIGSEDNSLYRLENGQCRLFPTEADRYLAKNHLQHGVVLSNEQIALATARQGVIIIDGKGHVIRKISKNMGLPDCHVKYLYEDGQGGLWMALNNGIARYELQSTLSFYKEMPGIESGVVGLARYEGRLYAATGMGIFYLQPSASPGVLPTFVAVPGIETQTTCLLNHAGSLFAGTGRGLFIIDENNATRLDKSSVYSLGRSLKHPDYVYVGLRDGLGLLLRENNRWRFAGRFPGISEFARSVVEDESGDLWIGTDYQYTLRIHQPHPDHITGKAILRVDRFNRKNGLPNAMIYTTLIGKDVVFISQKGLRRYDPVTNSFPVADIYGDVLGNKNFGIDVTLATDKIGRIWTTVFLDDENTQQKGVAIPDNAGRYVWNSERLQPLNRLGGFYAILPDPDEPDVVWWGGAEGLIRYDINSEKLWKPEPLLIRKVIADRDSLVYGGAVDSRTGEGQVIEAIRLPVTHNSLRIEYAAPDFYSANATQYRTMLEGIQTTWSHWTKETYKEYTHLPKGNYRFLVQSINSYGQHSKAAEFGFTILPPWYQTWWANLLYAIGVFGLIFGAGRWYGIYRSRKQEKELEHQRQLNKRLQQIDKLKDNFLANTSHELRTPLNGIIGLAESLIDGVTGKLPKKTNENLSMIAASGKRLASLVNDILDFSKLKTSSLELRLKPVDVRVLTNLVLRLSEGLIGSKKLVLKNTIPQSFPAVLADENRLQQILHNLIGNGIKFTESGSVTISAMEKDGTAEISVTDTGIGIPAEKQEAVFQSFEQVDSSIEREYGGTGLGLSISRQLIALHGGKIWVKSKPGKGAVFTFSLPVADGVAEVSNSQTISKVSPETVRLSDSNGHSKSPVTDNGDTFRILIVDDEPVNQQVLSNHLTYVNYHITQAFNGEEALKLLESGQKFDLVLLDIMMPKMSGYEVCQKIRRRFLPSELPVIMITAKNQVLDLVEGFSSGANDYLTKPVSKNELLARVKTHLNLYNINNAYGRFVPHEFLRNLGRDSIVDVKLGDQIEGEMTIWFSDIRSFTALSEKMTPKENFDFLNQFLANMIPPIRENNGFIDKYIGDAVMALFPDNPLNAILAAIAVLRKIQEYNRLRAQNRQTPVNIGIGLHTGRLMIGTIGDQERMDGTVISDAVNLASRLEGLTKKFGASLVVSNVLLSRINGAYSFEKRFLAKVLVHGKSKPISVYEVFSGDPESLQNLKKETLRDYENGLRSYFDRNFTEALASFKKVLDRNPADKAAKIYFERCTQYIGKGVTGDWQGIEKMLTK